MKNTCTVLLFASASILCGAAFGEIPPRKQKNPGACSTNASDIGAAGGIAITEEGGNNQHADRPKGKGKSRLKAPQSGGGACVAPGQADKRDGHSAP